MASFPTAPRGYDPDEVDAHLARLEARLEQVAAERDALRARLEQARSGRPDGRREPDETCADHEHGQGYVAPALVPIELPVAVLPAPSPPPPAPAPVDPATVHPPLPPHPYPRRIGRRRRFSLAKVLTAFVWLLVVLVAAAIPLLL